MDLYAAFLKEKYQGLGISPDSEWPPSVGNQYIRLALIEHECRLPNENSTREIQEDLLRGRVDKVEGNKKAINISGIFAGPKQEGIGLRVLVDGAPGVGKTTLCRKISKDWACNGILSEYKLALLLNLRERQIAKAMSIRDFFYTDDTELQEEVVRQVSKVFGAGVLFIFDGFDELSEEERTDKSLFLDIIKGGILHRCAVLVTSRPYASDNLQCLRSIVRHIEVLGFAEQQIRECIISTISDESRIEVFLNILKQRVDIISLCYIPLNCAILLYVYQQQAYELPDTLTKLFEIFICHALKREAKLRRQHKLVRKISYLKPLPPPLNSELEYLCKLAFNGLVKDKMVFQYEEIEENNLLGLMTAFKSFSCVGDNMTYQFLHLTIQEFLAAKWVATQMTPEEQAKFFKKHLSDDRFRMMLLFLAGITKLDDLPFNSIYSAEIDFPKQQCFLETDLEKLFFLLLHLLYESENPTPCHALACTIKEQTILLNGYKREFTFLTFTAFLQRSMCTWKRLRLPAANNHLDILLQQLEKEQSGRCDVSVQQLQVIENPNVVGGQVCHISVNKLASIPIFKNLVKLEINASLSKVRGRGLFLTGSQLAVPTTPHPDFKSVRCLLRNEKLKELTLLGVLEVNNQMIKECIAPELAKTMTLKVLKIGSVSISSSGFCSLFCAMKDNKSVEVLHVSIELKNLRSPEIGCVLESALGANEILQQLSIQMATRYPQVDIYNGLFRGITNYTTTLKVLTITDGSFLCDKGVLIKMLRNNKSLMSFSLTVGHLYQGCLDTLAAGLAQNTSLTRLCVKSTQETREPSFAKLFNAIRQNSSLKALYLDVKFSTINDESDPFSNFREDYTDSPDTSDRRVGANNLNDFICMLMVNRSLALITFVCNFTQEQLKAIAEGLVLSGRQTVIKVEFRPSLNSSNSCYGSVIQDQVDKYKKEFFDMLCFVLHVYVLYNRLL